MGRPKSVGVFVMDGDSVVSKICSRCKIMKPTSEYHPSKSPLTRGVKSSCKQCAKEVLAERPRARKRTQIKNQYNVEFYEIWETQKGLCLACEEPMVEMGKPRGLVATVDHDHSCCSSRRFSCGKCVRGLVHHACNVAIGRVRDDPEKLRKLASYLERTKRAI